MFSQTSEYAIRAAVFLAMRSPHPQTAQQIASECRVPIDYLFKVLQPLSRAGILLAQRGKNGGYSLMRDAAELTLFDIVQAVDPIKRIATCPLGLKEHGVRLCSVHRKIDEALLVVENTLRSATLAEMISPAAEVLPLCVKPQLIPEAVFHGKPQ